MDGGKAKATVIAPLIARLDFPEDWPIVLVLPENLQGTHGERERAAFTQLAGHDAAARQTDALCRLVLLGMKPSRVGEAYAALFRAISRHRVGDRPDRVEPRARKRRPKEYPHLHQPEPMGH